MRGKQMEHGPARVLRFTSVLLLLLLLALGSQAMAVPSPASEPDGVDTLGGHHDSGVDMENLATILFYDWDNTLIGVLTVEKGDARAAVNEFVQANLIHPNILAEADYDKVMNSLDRKYTYRGTYPSEGPGVGETVDDGEKYPLTNKLDYAFYRRPTALVKDPDSAAEYWQVEVNNPPGGYLYPYANGWAVVDDVKNIENVWTTFGTGELKNIDPTADYTTKDTAADYFKLIDFSKLEPGIHYVKACYEEGTSLDLGDFYTAVGDLKYMRANDYASTTKGSAYIISFQYERVSNGYGVVRTRDPSVRIAYTPDVEGVAGKPFYMEGNVDNRDVMDVVFTLSGGIQSMTYMLGDWYGQSSYITGAQRSLDGNEKNILTNFNTAEFAYNERFGTDGFVYWATLNQILKYGTLAAATGNADDEWAFKYLFTVETYADMNWRLSATDTIANSTYVAAANVRFLDLIKKAYALGQVDAKGNVDLDWHQIQYHIINYNSGGCVTDGKIMTPEECIAAYSSQNRGGFTWCRIDDCAETAAVYINDLSDLIVAAQKANNDAIPAAQKVAQNALDTLDMDWVNTANGYTGDPTSLRLRGGKTGDTLTELPYINNADFVTRLKAFVAAADTVGDGLTDMDDVWYQLQHALVNGGTYAPIGSVPVDDYWWKAFDNKPLSVEITDIPALLKAARECLDGSTVAWNNLSMADVGSVLRLYGSSKGDELSGLTRLTDAVAFKTAIQNLVTAAGDDYDKLTWYQVQNYLIKGTLTDDQKVSRHLYWWKEKDQKLPVTLEDLLDTVVEVMGMKIVTSTDFAVWTTLAVIDTPWDNPDDPNDLFRLGFRADDSGTHYTAANITSVATKLRMMFMKAKIAGYYDTNSQKLNLTWDQVQYYIINSAVVTPEVAEAEGYIWRPDWAETANEDAAQPPEAQPSA